MEARVQMPRLLGAHGKRGGQRERHDGTHDHGKLGAHKHGDDQGRTHKGHTGKQRHAGNAVQTLAHARNVALVIGNTARNQHDKQWHRHKEGRELHQLNGSQMQGIQAHQVGNGHRGDANGAVGRGHAVGQQADQHGRHGLKTKAREHAGGNGNSGTKAGHPLHKAAEAPGHEQRQQTAVAADGGDHTADHVHGARTHAQVIREHRRDNHEHDGPQGHQKALERGRGYLRRRQMPPRKGEHARKNKRTDGGLPSRPFKAQQHHDKPDDGHKSQQKRSDIHG